MLPLMGVFFYLHAVTFFEDISYEAQPSEFDKVIYDDSSYADLQALSNRDIDFFISLTCLTKSFESF